MKKILFVLFTGILTGTCFLSPGQVLNVSNTEQQHDQWCWAGSTKCVLDYYGFSTPQQCDIAEYVRSTATFHNFGSTDCCVNALQGCNYWNYNYGAAGSMQDILVHFGNLQNTGIATSLTLAEITTQIQQNKLFIIRWGWSGGGGHFIVGHGINGNNIYFMNPWFGEGLHIGTYSFMLSGVDGTSTSTHTWTHTNKITSDVSAIYELADNGNISAFPNPFITETSLHMAHSLKDATITLLNTLGQQVLQIKNVSGQTVVLQKGDLQGGIYFLQLTEGGKVTGTNKLVIADN
ncbi:MAG: T9SS type A sorting domain-containing protein [Bacteroidetes bacterium]|nr:T9SS type A sorting domain-containing protein [Bacteroidota bacterium]